MNNLKQYRALRNLTQQDLAKRIGVSRIAIYNAEKGRLSLSLAERCGEVLGVNRYAILGLDAVLGEPNQDEKEIIVAELLHTHSIYYKINAWITNRRNYLVLTVIETSK